MLTPKDIKRAQDLIDRRNLLQRAEWDCVAKKPEGVFGGIETAALGIEEFDEELFVAVQEFRKRRIAAVEEELRALGVEPEQPHE